MTMLQSKLKFELTLEFETGFRVGSGKEGETMSDLGIVRTPSGEPYIPGSSIKGKFRVTAERLAPHLNMSACLLDSELSGIICCSCQKWSRDNKNELKLIRNLGGPAKLQKINKITCDICKLFGSTLKSGRIFFSDAKVIQWAGVVQVRDGVVIDRDSETAVDHAKFDFETIPAGAKFQFTIEAENLSGAEKALIGATLFEWEQGFMLGGFSSRGLGRAKILEVKASEVDMKNSAQKFLHLTTGGMQEFSDWKSSFQKAITTQLNPDIK